VDRLSQQALDNSEQMQMVFSNVATHTHLAGF